MVKTNCLKNFDFSNCGWYLVTIYTKNRQEYFGNIINNKIILNKYGKIARKYWLEIPKRFFNIELDEFMVMPNHVHGIIVIQNTNQYKDALCQIIDYFEYQSTKYINGSMKESENKIIQIFQPSYYDQIIPNNNSLNKIRQYIRNDPKNWDEDKNNLLKGGEIINGCQN